MCECSCCVCVCEQMAFQSDGDSNSLAVNDGNEHTDGNPAGQDHQVVHAVVVVVCVSVDLS